MQKKYITILVSAVVAYLAIAGVSYFLFSTFTPKPKPAPLPATKLANGSTVFDQALPKTQPCPLNGVLYSTQQEAWWQKHRPLGVMIENHLDARPQSGLSFADDVYEAVAEGGITRFLAVFYCQDAPEVGPVRSARTYYIDWLSEYGLSPLYAHVGGANADGPANALGQLDTYGWTGYNDLNQFSIGFPTFWRDYDRLGHTVATEHTMYSTTAKLWGVGVSRGLTNVDKDGNAWDSKFVKYSFKDDATLSERPASQSMHLEFWSDQNYAVDWAYDQTTNTYKRSNGGAPHVDLDTKKQLAAKNVVVLFMKQLNADDGYDNNVHLLFQDKGTGKAVVFMDGKQIKATWEKDSRTSRTLLFNVDGTPLKFDRGLTWFEILPSDGVMTVK
ncbi:MAG: DUF3048 domain-containing protein [Candidatus Levyibacteriota bacterium]